jgi:hypothetical protein
MSASRSSLEFEGDLIEVPYAHLGLVCPRNDDMMAVARTLDAVACFWELEVLYEPYGALYVLTNRALSLGFGRAFLYKKVWQGRGIACGGAIDCVDFDRVCVHFVVSYLAASKVSLSIIFLFLRLCYSDTIAHSI